jgi:hypothetical protein
VTVVLEVAGRLLSLEFPEGWTYLQDSRHCEFTGPDAEDLLTIVAGASDLPEGSAEELDEAARQLAAMQGDRILDTARAQIGGKQHCTIKVVVNSPDGPSLRRQFHLSFPGVGNYFVITGTLAWPGKETDPDTIERRDGIFRAIATSFTLLARAIVGVHRQPLRQEHLQDGRYDLFSRRRI